MFDSFLWWFYANCSRENPGVFFVGFFSKALCNCYIQPELRKSQQYTNNNNHFYIVKKQSGVEVHISNPSSREAEAGGLQV